MLLRITKPTFSSLESKMAPSNEGEHGGKREKTKKKHQDDENRRKSFSNQRKRIYLVSNIFEAWENAKIEAGCKRVVTVISPRSVVSEYRIM